MKVTIALWLAVAPLVGTAASARKEAKSGDSPSLSRLRRVGSRQTIRPSMPPATTTTCPVTWPERVSLARATTSGAMSSGRAIF